MADERKRIIEQTASTEIFDDDWFIKDSALHNTTKISQTVLKQEILKDVKGVVELTQAEYDALPSSKLTDGILYAIKDSEDIIGNIENAINTLSGDIDDLEELVSTEMYNTAPMWSGSSYTFDDLVVYGIDGRLYRCIVRNSTANQFVPAEWQVTDIKAELYLLLQRIAPQFIASSQSYTQVYYKGNLVLHTNDYGVNTFYVCKQDLPQGDTEWVANHWEEVNTVSGLSKYLMDKIAEAGQIDDVQVKTTGDYESVVDENKVAKIDLSNMLIEKSVPNLPQSVATFNDGSDLPLKSLTASIEPLIGGNNNPPSSENIKPLSGQTSMQIVDMALPANYQPSSDGKIHLAWNNGSTNYDMPFNICQTETVKDSNNNDVDVCDIESHYVLPFDCVYDDPEAIYASASDLAAGDYYFKIVNDTWGNNNGKYVQFTLTEDLTAGKQIRKKSGGYNAAIENCTLGIFANGADKIGETLAFTVVTENPTGTSLGETDGTGDLNYWHCVVLGYNRWKYSAVRQYLNSDKAAGSWWTQQHKWDVKPAYADTKDGFLKGFDPELLHYMQVTKVTTARNTVFNSGDTPLGGMDETYDRVFLISLEQSYINPQISGEGEYWEYYKRLLGRITPASTGAIYARLIKYDLAAQTTARHRWLRSAHRGNAHIVWYVYASGGVYNDYASNGSRLAPCLRIGLSALNKYTVNFKDASNNPLTVVGGQLKINNGQASVDVYPYYASYNGETLTGEWISDRDEYTEGGTPTTGAQVLNIGGTPTTYALDDISIHSFDGVNNVFASTGDVTKLEYIANATDVIANLEARVTALENQ